MATNLAITGAAAINGAASFIRLRFLITSGATTISDTYYNFHANHFACIYDSSAPNICVLHMGEQHVLTLSNGDFSTITYDGSGQADVITAAFAIVTGVAPFTT